MKRLFGVVLLLWISLSGILLGSQIKLIEPAEAIRLIGNNGVVFVSADDNDAYEKNHIIGSVEMYVHNLHLPDIKGDMRCAPPYICLPKAQSYIQTKGIKNNQMIIAYDNFYGSNATGIYNFFESLGHKDIRVLNGGLEGIKALDPNQQVFDKLKAERKMTKNNIATALNVGKIDEVEKLKSKAKGITAKMNMLEPKLLVQGGKEKLHGESDYQLDPTKFNMEYIADKAEVKKALNDIIKNGENCRSVIIYTCSMEKKTGIEKIDNAVKDGDIHGIKFIDWKNITDMKNKKSFKPLKEMQKIFEKLGIKRSQTIYAYCQVDSSASSHIISALRLLDYKKVKVFTGSLDSVDDDINLPANR